jgi:hypothetical protein
MPRDGATIFSDLIGKLDVFGHIKQFIGGSSQD